MIYSPNTLLLLFIFLLDVWKLDVSACDIIKCDIELKENELMIDDEKLWCNKQNFNGYFIVCMDKDRDDGFSKRVVIYEHPNVDHNLIEIKTTEKNENLKNVEELLQDYLIRYIKRAKQADIYVQLDNRDSLFDSYIKLFTRYGFVELNSAAGTLTQITNKEKAKQAERFGVKRKEMMIDDMGVKTKKVKIKELEERKRTVAIQDSAAKRKAKETKEPQVITMRLELCEFKPFHKKEAKKSIGELPPIADPSTDHSKQYSYGCFDPVKGVLRAFVLFQKRNIGNEGTNHIPYYYLTNVHVGEGRLRASILRQMIEQTLRFIDSDMSSSNEAIIYKQIEDSTVKEDINLYKKCGFTEHRTENNKLDGLERIFNVRSRRPLHHTTTLPFHYCEP